MEDSLKQLLLKDICARLPYKPKCQAKEGNETKTFVIEGLDNFPIGYEPCFTWSYLRKITDIDSIKLFLRPMSSMTEEEKENFYRNVLDMDVEDVRYENDGELPLPYNQKDRFIWFENIYIDNVFSAIDWLNEHHFDFRNLIDKGLALEAPEGMYKEDMI